MAKGRAGDSGKLVAPNCLHLEDARAARLPDSEAVSDRLTLLADAIGSRSPRLANPPKKTNSLGSPACE
jgi:hypothetical protein